MVKEKKNKERFVAPAGDIMKLAKHLADNGTDEEKASFCQSMKKGSQKAGEHCMNKALKEGLFTDAEWADWKEKYAIDLEDIGDVLAVYFAVKNGEFPDEKTPIILTSGDSGKFRARDAIKEKFDIEVVGPEEGMKLMEAEMAKDDEENRKKAKEEATYIG